MRTVICRLVEEQDVGLAPGELRKGQPGLLAAAAGNNNNNNNNNNDNDNNNNNK